jgi:hypothetical protein
VARSIGSSSDERRCGPPCHEAWTARGGETAQGMMMTCSASRCSGTRMPLRAAM